MKINPRLAFKIKIKLKPNLKKNYQLNNFRFNKVNIID